MGYPLYAKLGYRDLGALQMWERRRSRPMPVDQLKITNVTKKIAGSSTISA